MTAEPTYEYRVVSIQDDVYPMESADLAKECAAVWNRWSRATFPFRAQRRLVTPWEDVPDGE